MNDLATPTGQSALDLRGASVLVAGASGGLGAPISRALSEAGALLTLVARDRARLGLLGLPAEIVAADLRRPAGAIEVVAAAVPDQVLVDLFTINTLADAVATRIVSAIRTGERDMPSSSFG